jgi:putative tryptophan/tyrosine transport system permease protein
MTLNEVRMSLEIGLIYGLVALGIYIPFRGIDFSDLSGDGSFVVGAAISVLLIQGGYHPLITIPATLMVGAAVGMVTGTLTLFGRVSSLLSGILVAFMLYSINLRIMGGIPNRALIGFPTLFTLFSPVVVLGAICLAAYGAVSYFFISDLGLALRSVGYNKRLAQNNGVSISAMTLLGLCMSNALIALGGALFCQHQGFSDVGCGVGTVIVGLVSTMIGESLFRTRSLLGPLLGCFIGSIIYRIFISFALYADVLGLQAYDLNLLTGLMVIITMQFSRKPYA